MIKLLFFGRLGDFAQGVSTSIDAVDGLTPAAVRDGLAAGHPQLVYELSQPQVLISLNQMIVDGITLLSMALSWHFYHR